MVILACIGAITVLYGVFCFVCVCEQAKWQRGYGTYQDEERPTDG
jgi:hypothetical protein